MSCDYKVPSKIAIFVMNSRRRYKQNLDAYSIHEGSIMQGDTASAQRGHFLRCLLYLVFLLSILLFNSAISPVMADSSSVPSEPYEATESADYSNANGDFWESYPGRPGRFLHSHYPGAAGCGPGNCLLYFEASCR